MIPQEAIEAAADWLPHSTDCQWRPERDCQCRHLRMATMRAVLEAAAPFIQADAKREALEDAAQAWWMRDDVRDRFGAWSWLLDRAAAMRGEG